MSGTQTEAGSSAAGPGEPAGRPGRYQRSVGGLIGAMIILIGAVVVFVGFRGLVRDNPDTPPVEPVAYEQVVGPAAEQIGWPVAAPSSLPQGWVARSVRFEPPPGASWHLGLLTDDQEYVGIEQSVATAAAMVEAYVGEDAQRAGALVRLPVPQEAGGSGSGADEAAELVPWQRWTDGGGDIAVTTRLGDRTLLVVTSGTQQELRTAVESLSLQD